MQWREKFRNELKTLNDKIYSMAAITVDLLRDGLTAIQEKDTRLAAKVIEEDKMVDALQGEIEDLAAMLIAMEQPVAGDLREIVSAIKIVSSIERIADHAKHLAEGTERISDAGRKQFLPVIVQMAEQGIDMLETAVKAYLDNDAELAQSVAAKDEKIDSLKKELTVRILEFMKSSPENVEEGASFLFLNRFMERMGDHVTNVCEWVYFTHTGNHIDLN
ncbi:phosphate signaling complex protein PhoU [Salinispira pacifica]|uniref:Phosphate-specific transport system accessory protein PhoU n=1 Tax=Salinispira pacifica TaxID=1307761 RepID=V5WEA3_9SPIO|nr:phosphate signaling complex protein PhoU [Salinispira pacifica]AHC13899.1 Phosphate transport system regulatory protein PhoU [Salinispira pacifica]